MPVIVNLKAGLKGYNPWVFNGSNAFSTFKVVILHTYDRICKR